MKNYICIDIGGTNYRIAKISENGEVVDNIKHKQEADKGLENFQSKLSQSINELKDMETSLVSVIVPGQVSECGKKLYFSPNLPFGEIDFGKLIKEKCGLEVCIENDANGAALGEANYGAGKEFNSIYYVTWSTGIGGAPVIKGELFKDRFMCTGEIGNMIVSNDQIDFSKEMDMLPMSIETLIGGHTFSRKAKEFGYDSVQEMFSDFDNVDVVLFIEDMTTKFAIMLANIVHTIEVEAFVLGGGVIINNKDLLLEKITRKFNFLITPPLKNEVEIKTAMLGDEAGQYGALALAKKENNARSIK